MDITKPAWCLAGWIDGTIVCIEDPAVIEKTLDHADKNNTEHDAARRLP